MKTVDTDEFVIPALTDLGVDEIQLIRTEPAVTDGSSLFCTVEVAGTQFDTQIRSSQPLRVASTIGATFVLEPRVLRKQEKREAIYDYFVDHWHGFTGRLPTPGLDPEHPEQYDVFSTLLTGYSQDILENTEVSVESYVLVVEHATVGMRGE